MGALGAVAGLIGKEGAAAGGTGAGLASTVAGPAAGSVSPTLAAMGSGLEGLANSGLIGGGIQQQTLAGMGNLMKGQPLSEAFGGLKEGFGNIGESAQAFGKGDIAGGLREFNEFDQFLKMGRDDEDEERRRMQQRALARMARMQSGNIL